MEAAMIRVFTLATILVLLPLAQPAAVTSITPDLLLINAHIVTMNERRPEAEAVAISGGRILWIGANTEARRLYGNSRETLDLNGATVLPGFIDAHTHLMTLGESYLKLNIKDIPTEQAVAALVKHRSSETPRGEWIFGWGWDEGAWAANYPTYRSLTEAAPDNPVFLTGLHGFAGWANKRALDLAGINRGTPDPDNGKIIRDPKTGEATGILTNRAQELIQKHIPALNISQVKRAIELASDECIRNGLTSVHEARVTRVMIQAFRELVKEHRLKLRVYGMLDFADKALIDEWLARGPEIDSANHLFTIRSVKVFADGALGSRGAAMLEPYSDEPRTRGVVTTSQSEIFELTRRCLQRGFQVATHAIGDGANHMALDAYEQAMKAEPKAGDPRLRIEHAQVLAPMDIPRFARLNVIASMQPTHCTSDMAWAEKRVGPKRIQGAYAWRSVLATGAHLPLSSDFPGETLNPFYGIYAAITRQSPDGRPEGGWYPDQRLSVAEALKGYTTEAAYAEFEERNKGSIEPGKLADLIVISGNEKLSSPAEWLNVRVLKTFINGRLVYNADVKK